MKNKLNFGHFWSRLDKIKQNFSSIIAENSLAEAISS